MEVVEDGMGDLAHDRLLDVVVADGLAVEAQLGGRSSAYFTPVHRARVTIDSSMVTEIRPISSRVVAAFLLLGFWNAGTPLEMASTPVRAAQPEEKARSIRNAIASPLSAVCCGSATSS